MQVGLDKVAAYRDEDGTLKTFSAVCPHLKCSVMYNPKDNTFDCPCHGSHFDTNGECIQGGLLFLTDFAHGSIYAHHGLTSGQCDSCCSELRKV